MTTETVESTQDGAATPQERANALTAAIRARHQQVLDPVGYAKARFIAETDGQLAEIKQMVLAGLLDAGLVQQYEELRTAEYADRFPEPEAPPALATVRTFEGLNLILIGGDEALPPTIREYAQMIQPERGCAAEDAEHFLAKAAYRDIRGGLYTDGPDPQPIAVARYSVDREADKITLRLHA